MFVPDKNKRWRVILAELHERTLSKRVAATKDLRSIFLSQSNGLLSNHFA